MKPLQLDFKPSMLASALFTLMSLGALSIVILLDFSWPFNWQHQWLLRWLLSTMIIVSAIYAVLYHGLLLLPWSCVGLKVSKKNQLQLILKNGDILEVVVQANSVVTLYLTVLNSQVKHVEQGPVGQKHDLVYDSFYSMIHRLVYSFFHQHHMIFFDAVNADDYRQLRVWLRWAACHSAAIKQTTPL